jgi:hypothetical protein
MSGEVWLKIAAVILGVPLVGALLASMVLAVSYQITPRYLLIRWLGIPIRWVRLRKIRSVGTTPIFWAERWPNALSAQGRYLVVRKDGWLFKNLVITPKTPFVFRAELYRARDALMPPPEATAADGPHRSGTESKQA